MPATVLVPAASRPEEAPRHRLTLVHPPERGRGETTARGEIRVLVAHGQALVRAGMSGLLEAGQSISVIGEASDGDEAIVLARRLEPHVVLMDATLPDLDVEAIRQISALAGVQVMMLTASESDECVLQSLRAGVTAFLLQDAEPAELVRAVRLVARGESLLSPSLTRRLIVELVSRPEVPQPSADELEELTKREREVMALVALGLNNDEIAEHLVVSPATAKTHVSRAMVKLHARDRAQLVVFAYEAGLVRPRADATTADAQAFPVTR
jgi:DNA-binding NarL/FixJ family response regulator